MSIPMQIRNSFSFIKSSLLIILCFNLLSCAISIPQIEFVTDYPLPLDKGISALSNNLMVKVLEYQEKQNNKVENALVVIDPFLDSHTGEVVNASRNIEQLISNEINQHFKQFSVRRLSSQSLPQAHYVINGVLTLDKYQFREESTAKEYYRVKSSLIDLSNGKVVASFGAWISQLDLDYTPTAIYKESPLFIKNNQVDTLLAIAQDSEDVEIGKKYYDFLPTNALLVEAESVYEKQDYKTALSLFLQAVQRKDGKTTRTYAGLYETYLKLNQLKAAESAFNDLLEASIVQTGKLQVKFLFAVNSTEFVEDNYLKKQYTSWLDLISRYFKNNQHCFYLEGHSSHSGPQHYNEVLSRERAKHVQNLMKTEFNFVDVEHQSSVVGKGFSENLVGIGTDDARDAIDRRVEFVVVDCGQCSCRQ